MELSKRVHRKWLLKHLALLELCLWKDGHQVHLGNVMCQCQKSEGIQESVRNQWYQMLFLGFSEINKKGKLFQKNWV